MAVGTSVACGRPRACGQQNRLQPHQRLLRNRRNDHGLCFHFRNGSNVVFFFKLPTFFRSQPASLVSFDRGCVAAVHDDPDRRVACERATRVVNVPFHPAVTALGVLIESELTEQITSIGRGCFQSDPWSSERASTDHHSSVSYSTDVLEEKVTRAGTSRVDSRQPRGRQIGGNQSRKRRGRPRRVQTSALGQRLGRRRSNHRILACQGARACLFFFFFFSAPFFSAFLFVLLGDRAPFFCA